MKKEETPNSPPSSHSSHQSDRHAIIVTPTDPVTAGPSTSTADGFTAGPTSISSFFKPVKCANPATPGSSTSASNSADNEVFEGF